MTIKQFQIWTADLNPRLGTESGKVRPVLIIQTDLLNSVHPSTVVCPITSNIQPGANILRVHLKKGMAGLKTDSDILIDQIRAIDNKRFIQKLGKLPAMLEPVVKENLTIVLDL